MSEIATSRTDQVKTLGESQAFRDMLADVSALAPLKSLKSLTISGTHATKAALAPLSKGGVTIHGDDNAG